MQMRIIMKLVREEKEILEAYESGQLKVTLYQKTGNLRIESGSFGKKKSPGCGK